ncbi:sensor histidine kinase [Rufibacter glacialis]|uniref:Histidine kinase n=1 Tax=Rufibacter glacialis TaxID=1259555 RepID=A0A5M8QEF2_9BACT|nr:histidine kinase [Rufibacter glacialis]KAA6434417.1 histidine kinase [Rufibacter glacialis]GGK69396.1 histidine kinase [Rufibacter glacialis]
MMKKLLSVLLHVLLWLALLSFSLWVHFNLDQKQVPWTWVALDVAQTFAFHLALFYFNWFVLLPRLLAKGNVAAYALAVVTTLVVFAAVRSPIEIFQNKKQASRDPKFAEQLTRHPGQLDYKNVMIPLLVMGIMNVFLSSALKVTGDYLRTERRRKELELQQATTELELLKAQVNPHFLFNTLNNLYSLAYQGSPSTADAIMKLSLLLRYQLYETDAQLVPLAREVEHLHHLLDLHRLRLTNPSLLGLQVKGETGQVSVPPMLLMPLVENMFKHGLTSAPMQVQVTVENGTLTFTTHNRLKTGTNPERTFGGIGLQNLKRRLELLYPNAHSFSTQQQDQEFTATLTLTRLS